MRTELAGKLALITGSTDGIGAETAKLFAAEGAMVIVSGRDRDRGEAIAGQIRDDGGKAHFVQTDLSDLNALQWLASQAGNVDILVNNAAIGFMAPGPTSTPMVLDQMDPELARQIASTTLLNRQATPREIVEVVLFIASDRSSYMTGALVPADARRTAV